MSAMTEGVVADVEDVLEGEPEVVFHHEIPQSRNQSIKDRLRSAMDTFQKTGVSEIHKLPAEVFVSAKFPSDVKPPRGWEMSLAGKTAGEVTCGDAIEAAAGAILDLRQCSMPLKVENGVRLSINASKDTTLTEGAAEQAAGKFATVCGYGV